MSTVGQIETPESALPEDRQTVTPEKIVAVVERIVTVAKPWKVRAFGSRARGDHRPDSDLDLAVIVEDGQDGMEQHRAIRTGMRAGFSMDMLLMTRTRYEFMKDSIVSVQRDIFDEGVTLYDAGDGRIDRRAAARLAA